MRKCTPGLPPTFTRGIRPAGVIGHMSVWPHLTTLSDRDRMPLPPETFFEGPRKFGMAQ